MEALTQGEWAHAGGAGGRAAVVGRGSMGFVFCGNERRAGIGNFEWWETKRFVTLSGWYSNTNGNNRTGSTTIT